MIRRLLFRTATALLAWTTAGYPLLLWLLRPRVAAPVAVPADAELPSVALIIPAYAEAEVIAQRVANALALDYPRTKLTVVVACDGSPDETAVRAREAGADLVLELPRAGKVRTQDAAVAASAAEIVAFSDANALWEPDALRALVAPVCADPRVAYVCGRVRFVNPDGGTNQEGRYWRYEMAIRERESELWSVTAGNGAIYALRRSAYVEVDAVMGHDLKLPFTIVRGGARAVEQRSARATERMVPDVEGEAARKRRMMSHAWAIVLGGGLLDPRGWPARYAAMMFSHRWLRYASPLLHLVALITASPRLRLVQLALAAPAAMRAPRGPLAIIKYYVLMQGATALGLYDHLRTGTEAGWSPPEGTRVAEPAAVGVDG